MGTVAKVNGIAIAGIAAINGTVIADVAAIGGEDIPASNPSAIVSGAGSTVANGEWTPRGTETGRPFYCPLGSPTVVPGDAGFCLYSDSGLGWVISSDVFASIYFTPDDVNFPWLATTWNVEDGIPPAPTVTQG